MELRGRGKNEDDDGFADGDLEAGAIVHDPSTGKTPSNVDDSGSKPLAPLFKRPQFVVITLLSVLTRFIHLGHPSSVVFDEVHFGKFANFYMKGIYFFDIHPPLGKLVLALWGTLIGYPANYEYNGIGREYPTADYAYLRMCPAFFSALVPPFAYMAATEAGLSQASSFLVGSFLLWDNCVIGEGKFILVDSQLYFWTVFAMWSYFKARRGPAIVFGPDGSFHLHENYMFIKWHLLAGLGMFLAFSVKWTGLGLVGVIGIDVFIRLLTKLRDGARMDLWVKEFVVKLVLLLLIPLLVYFFIFLVHFWCLPLSGPGDAFMSWEFKKRLIGSKEVIPEHVQKKGLFASVFELHRVMYVSNSNLKATHNWGSTWAEWPTMSGRGVLYWSQKRAKIYLNGNPLVWWGTTAAVVLFMGIMSLPVVRAIRLVTAADPNAVAPVVDPSVPKLRLAERVRRSNIYTLGVIFVSCYFANLLPFMLVTRVCFAYHFVPSLIQGSFLAAAVLEIFTFDRPRARYLAAIAIFIIQGLTFYKFAPWTYGLPADHNTLRWRSNWV